MIKRIKKWFRKRKWDIPLPEMKIYRIPENKIIGTILGTSWVSNTKQGIMEAFLQAHYHYIKNGLDPKNLTLICHPDSNMRLEILYNKYIGISLRQILFEKFKLDQLVIDRRLHKNQITLENNINMAMSSPILGMHQGLYQYHIFLRSK